jgi:hypothetical protein
MPARSTAEIRTNTSFPPYAHPAPVQRLHVHSPERLDGARARVRPHPETRPRPPILPALPAPFFPAQLAQFVSMSAGFFDADEMPHPAIERPLQQPMPAAILRPAQAAPAPRFNVHRPVRAVGPFPRTCSHAEILQCAKNPDVTRRCTLGQCAIPGRLQLFPDRPWGAPLG